MLNNTMIPAELNELENYLKKLKVRPTESMIFDIIKLSLKTVDNIGYNVFIQKKSKVISFAFLRRSWQAVFGEIIKAKK